VSGNVIFGPDCASFQGNPDWARISAVCRFGAEKVTEGAGSTAYANPRWAAAKPAMAAVGKHGFVPLAYMFLDAVEPGAAQADWFARNAGDLTGFGIVVDVERAPNGSPTQGQAQDAARELRKLYPHHPIGGYAPRWFTGGWSLTFFDWLWASSYVLTSGDPAVLYAQVPASWWAPYGGESPLLLQFTNQAKITGISGLVDCSAFHGTEAQFSAHVLPAPPAPPPPPVPVPTPAPGPAPAPGGEVDSLLIRLVPHEAPVSVPVWARAGQYHEPGAYSNVSLNLAGDSGAAVKVTVYDSAHGAEVFTPGLVTGQDHPIVPSHGWSTVRTVALQRLDTKSNLGASAVLRTW
jgi:GH25 family lysozyme M1 (1,4-beta-N-acetylmuramidase)